MPNVTAKSEYDKGLAPEEEQLLECLRAYAAGGKARLIIDPKSESELGGLIDLAHKHKLLPVVCGTLAGESALFKSGAAAAWRAQAKRQAAASALRSHEFCGVINALRERGCEPVVLKGELLKRLYSDPHSRLSSDEDIYLAADGAEGCLALLKGLGFAADDGADAGAEVVSVTSRSGLHLELHRVLCGGMRGGEARHFEGALARTVYVSGGEAELRSFAPTDEVYYLICHAAKHFASCGFGVRTALDIAVYTMRNYKELDLAELERLLEASGLICFASGVYDMAAKHMGYDAKEYPLPFIMKDGGFIADGGAMLADCLAGGVYGKSSMQRAQSAKYTKDAQAGQGSHFKTLLSAAFPKKGSIEGEYPFVKEHPMLLPLAWGKRILKYLASGRRDAEAGAAIGRKRIRLLQSYGMAGAEGAVREGAAPAGQTSGAAEGKAQGKTVRRVRADELMPHYLEAMGEKGSVTIPVSGGSMSPFLTHLRDSVTLCPIGQRRVRRGDIVLYTRQGSKGERYVMHRAVGIRRDGYVFCGDGQVKREFGVKRQSMLAVATAARRKGRAIGPHSVTWLFYRHVWRVLRPFRGAILRLYGRVKPQG